MADDPDDKSLPQEPDDGGATQEPDDGALTEEPVGAPVIEDGGGGGDLGTKPVLGTAIIAGPTFVNTSVTYEVVDGMAVFEGDIVLGPARTVQAAAEAAEVAAAGAVDAPFGIGVIGVGARWPAAQIPYETHDSIPISNVTPAMVHWQQRTPIRFVQRTPTNAAQFPNYVRFIAGPGNSSYVGMIGGKQDITLFDVGSLVVTVHEIGHAIGLWHEQSRKDRETYVTIRWGNIPFRYWDNFQQRIDIGVDLGPYDYDSIMHYARNAFAIDPAKDTITPTDPNVQIGGQHGTSAGDVRAVMAMYANTGGAPVRAFVLPSAWGAGTAWLGGFGFADPGSSSGAAGLGTGSFVYRTTLPSYVPEQRFAGVSAIVASGRAGYESDVTLIVNGKPQATYRVPAQAQGSNGTRYQWVFAEEVLLPGQQNTIAFSVDGGASMPNGVSLFERAVSSVPDATIEVAVPYALPIAPVPVAYEANFLKQDVPAMMLAGVTYEVWIKMWNPNDRVWRSDRVWLRSEEPADNMTWNTNRVNLPGGIDLPGHSDALFEFTVQAPQELGPTLFRWGMAAAGYGRFGQRNAPISVMVARDALFIGQDVPATIVGGTTAEASVTFRNISSVAWAKGTNIRLGSQGPPDNTLWGHNRVELPHDVASGANVTFKVPLTAPVPLGKYVFQWQIMHDGVGWLGQASPAFEVRVMPALITEAKAVSYIVANPIPPGAIQMVAVTMKNTGTDTWTPGKYMLGSQTPESNSRWGTNRVALPHPVPPNAEVTFTFGITSRDAAGVSAIFQWQMRRDPEGWFGQMTSPPLEVNIAATQQPKMDLCFLKTRNVPGAFVQAFTATKSSNYATISVLNTRFRAEDAANGWFGIHRNGNIYFVKVRNTASGMVEVHTATLASQYTQGISAVSRFSVGDAANGTFGVLPNGDLYFVKTKNTGSGTIEAFTALAPTFDTGLQIGTRIPVAEGPNGWFGILPNNDLYFVKTRNTGSGKVEVITATSASWYKEGIQLPSRLAVADADNGTFGMLPYGDVYFVKTGNAASGKVELNIASRSSNYGAGPPKLNTRFGVGEGPNGVWGMI